MKWQVARLACSDHVEWSRRESALFASPQWGCVLESLGATTWFAWDPAGERGAVVPVFRLPGVSVGYLGFPVAGEVLERASGDAVEDLAMALSRACGLNMLRTVASIETPNSDPPTSLLPEVRIRDLQSWSPGKKKLRKDLSFARRRAAEVCVCGDATAAEACHPLYRGTVLRHGGKVRYTREYFRRLIALSAATDLVRVFTASLGSGVDGFAVVARNGRTAYYLHGAVNEAGRAAGASDLLLEQVVKHAKTLGCESLSLMASPWAQQGLKDFKRKWGDSEGIVATRDIAVDLRGAAIRAISRWRGRKDRAAALAWLEGR